MTVAYFNLPIVLGGKSSKPNVFQSNVKIKIIYPEISTIRRFKLKLNVRGGGNIHIFDSN